MKKIILALGMMGLLSGTASASRLLEFAKRGFERCTGHCEKDKINCQKGVDQQGYYDWCKANCLNESRSDFKAVEAGIKSCETPEPVKERVNSCPDIHKLAQYLQKSAIDLQNYKIDTEKFKDELPLNLFFGNVELVADFLHPKPSNLSTFYKFFSKYYTKNDMNQIELTESAMLSKHTCRYHVPFHDDSGTWNEYRSMTLTLELK